ncbi:hypothetical protein HMPREF0262_01297 [Clostridium sp. ATCC 29733]|nr:hypothetical protein HMPREF0262_01297 [Clostridium sp. ATCC 29733]
MGHAAHVHAVAKGRAENDFFHSHFLPLRRDRAVFRQKAPQNTREGRFAGRTRFRYSAINGFLVPGHSLVPLSASKRLQVCVHLC